jgi:serine/threonine protein kinase
MIQLCAGLGAAHNASVYHRDIKPGNIFVRADGILKILDFGVARLASSSMTAAGFIVGTPDYMSPEQARGAEIDGRSDIFSLGGVCYFMVTGRKPFPSEDLPTLFHQIQSEDPQPLLDGEAPPQMAAVIMGSSTSAMPVATQRSIVTDKQIEFFAEVFGIHIQQLFPVTRHFVCVETEFHEPKHRHRHEAKTRLARRRKK